jgi:GDP-L-fucose synthase
MRRNAKVFIAGGTGMVGSAIIRGLLAMGFTNLVANYHRRPPEPRLFNLPAGEAGHVSFVPLDLTRQNETEHFFEHERPEYVFFSAARVGGILANDTYKADFIYENIAMAANVVRTAHRSGTAKLLNLGSSCIYPRLAPQPMREEQLLTGELEATNEPYAVAKIAAIKLCRYHNEQFGTNFLSVMPTNLYGPNDSFDLVSSHVLPALIRKFHLAKLLGSGDFEGIKMDFLTFGNSRPETKAGTLEITGDSPADDVIRLLAHFGIFASPGSRQSSVISHQSPVTTPSDPRPPLHALRFTNHESRSVTVSLWGTGEPYREFLHVDDLASACIMLMENFDAADIGEFVNIGCGEDIRIGELADLTAHIVGFEGPIVWDASKPDGTPRKLLDIGRIRALGWLPVVNLRHGIEATYRWYTGQHSP